MKVSTRVWRADLTAAGGVRSRRPPSWVSELETQRGVLSSPQRLCQKPL